MILTLTDALNKPYEVRFLEENIEQSFYDVAKSHRVSSNETFQLDSGAKTWCGLFSSKTNSETAVMSIIEAEPVSVIEKGLQL